MVAVVIVTKHKRGAITRISLCFISCSLNETTCKTYKTREKSPHSGPALPAVTNGGATVAGHTTPPTAGRQPPKMEDLSFFRTFRDEWRGDPMNWDRHKCRGTK